MYGRICDPSRGACVDSDYVPSKETHDFKIATNCVQPWAGQESLAGTALCGLNTPSCLTSLIYYYAITAADGISFSKQQQQRQQQQHKMLSFITSDIGTSDGNSGIGTSGSSDSTSNNGISDISTSITNPTSSDTTSVSLTVQAYMRTYRTADRIPTPLRFTTDFALRFDVYNGHLQWKQMEQCVKWNAQQQHICESSELLKRSHYRVFYVERFPGNESKVLLASEPNVGTVCGMLRAAIQQTGSSLPRVIPSTNQLEKAVQLEQVLPFFAEPRDYSYRINVMSDSSDYPGEASVSYKPIIASRTHDDLEYRFLKIIFVMLFTAVAALLLFLTLLGIVYAVFHFTRRKHSAEYQEQQDEKISLIGSVATSPLPATLTNYSQ